MAELQGNGARVYECTSTLGGPPGLGNPVGTSKVLRPPPGINVPAVTQSMQEPTAEQQLANIENARYWQIIHLLAYETATRPQPFLKAPPAEIYDQAILTVKTAPEKPDRSNPGAYKHLGTGGTAHVFAHGDDHVYKFKRLNLQEVEKAGSGCSTALQFALETKLLGASHHHRSPYVVDVEDAHVVQWRHLDKYVARPEDAHMILTEHLKGRNNCPADAVLVIKMPRLYGCDTFDLLVATRVPRPIPAGMQHHRVAQYSLRVGGLHIVDGGDLCSWISEVFAGLEYLHSLGVMHGDIKPENIFCGRHPAKGLIRIKIADIDGAQPVNAHGFPFRLPQMTPGYTLLKWFGVPDQIRSDSYALGCSIWEFLFGRRALQQLYDLEAGVDKPCKPIHTLLCYVAVTNIKTVQDAIIPTEDGRDGKALTLAEYQQRWSALIAPIAHQLALRTGTNPNTTLSLGTEQEPSPLSCVLEYLYMLKGQTLAQAMFVMLAQCMYSEKNIIEIRAQWQPILEHGMSLPMERRMLYLPVNVDWPKQVPSTTTIMKAGAPAEDVQVNDNVNPSNDASNVEDIISGDHAAFRNGNSCDVGIEPGEEVDISNDASKVEGITSANDVVISNQVGCDAGSESDAELGVSNGVSCDEGLSSDASSNEHANINISNTGDSKDQEDVQLDTVAPSSLHTSVVRSTSVYPVTDGCNPPSCVRRFNTCTSACSRLKGAVQPPVSLPTRFVISAAFAVSQLPPTTSTDLHTSVSHAASHSSDDTKDDMADTFTEVPAAGGSAASNSLCDIKGGIANTIAHPQVSVACDGGSLLTSFTNLSTSKLPTALRRTTPGTCQGTQHSHSVERCHTHPYTAASAVKHTGVAGYVALSTTLTRCHLTTSASMARTRTDVLDARSQQQLADVYDDMPQQNNSLILDGARAAWLTSALSKSSPGIYAEAEHTHTLMRHCSLPCTAMQHSGGQAVSSAVSRSQLTLPTNETADTKTSRYSTQETDFLIPAVHDGVSQPRLAHLPSNKHTSALSRTAPGAYEDIEQGHIIIRCCSLPGTAIGHSSGQDCIAANAVMTGIQPTVLTRRYADSMVAMCSHTGADLYEEVAVPATGKPMSLFFDKVKSFVKKPSISEEAAPKAATTTNNSKLSKVTSAKKRFVKALRKLAGCFSGPVECDEFASV